MIKIFIDSTAFKSEPCRLSKPFAQISELSILGYLEIHLSIVNVDEVYTWIEESISINHQAINDSLTKAFSFKLSDKHYKNTQSLLAQASSILESTKVDAKLEFKEWLSRAKVTIHDIESNDGKSVMAAYFSGEKPFKHVKHRPDIPDAFIWESLKRFSNQEDELYFISSDNNFREKVNSSFSNINCFESLKKLFEYQNMVDLIEEWSEFIKQADSDAVIELISSELILQKQYINKNFDKLIKDHFVGSKLSLMRNSLIGEVSELNFIDQPELQIDYIKVDKSTSIYLTFDCELEFSLYVLVPMSNSGTKVRVRDEFFDNVYFNENSSDSHYSAEEFQMARIYGDVVIELPKINASSGKEDVIEAIDDCELILATLRTERLN